MLIVLATEKEISLVKDKYPGARILITGVGGLNIVEALKDYPRDTPIINIGYVGSNCIKIGTEVNIGHCGLYHPNVTYIEPTYELPGTATCFTSNDFVLSTDIKEPVVFDMELAYILALGFTNVISIKTVSDNLNYQDYENMADGTV